MAWIHRRETSRVQPQALRAVSPVWRSRGLVALFDTRAGIELLHNNPASNLTSTLSPAVAGMAADFSGTANQQYAHRPAYATTGALTLVIMCEVDALSGYGALIAKQATTTTYCPYELRIGDGSTDSKISFLRANTNYHIWSHSTDIVSAAANTRQTLIFRTNGQARLEDAPTVIVNGVKTTLDTEFNSGVTGAVTDNGASVWIGRRSDGATQLDGRIYYVALFNRAISDFEAFMLTANPWQLYAKRQRQVFRASAATTVPARYYFDMLAGRGNLWG